MSRVFVIADLHLGHAKAAQIRGFKDVAQHDYAIVEAWNRVVTKRDVVVAPGSGAAEGEAMSTELTGRALDEAAARAMGWTPTSRRGKWTDNRPLIHPGPTPQMSLRRYSTDPAHIPEMLAWLHEHSGNVVIYTGKRGATAEPVDRKVASQIGATISEALARLVVAVAESRR